MSGLRDVVKGTIQVLIVDLLCIFVHLKEGFPLQQKADAYFKKRLPFVEYDAVCKCHNLNNQGWESFNALVAAY